MTSPSAHSTKSIQALLDLLNNVILGKEPQIKLALACLLARGHLLIEDLPGMGKTTQPQSLGQSMRQKIGRASCRERV